MEPLRHLKRSYAQKSTPFLYYTPGRYLIGEDYYRSQDFLFHVALPAVKRNYQNGGRRGVKDSWEQMRHMGGAAVMHEPTYIKEGVRFTGKWELAKRGSNGLRRSLIVDNRDPSGNSVSRYGYRILQGINTSELAPHNHMHFRRVERWVEQMLMQIPELRHGSTSLESLTDAIGLFSYFHDLDQLLVDRRNIEEHTSLNSKKGHATAAAVMVMAFAQKYAEVRAIPIDEAKDVCNVAALLIMGHDEFERFPAVVRGKKAPNNNNKKELYRSFHNKNQSEDDQLDITQLTSRHILDLLQYEKKEAGFAIAEGGFGLDPYFEEEYKEELSALYNDTHPIGIHINKSKLKLATELVWQADIVDMNIPFVESLFRLLTTSYAHDRRFLNHLEQYRNTSEKQELMDSIYKGIGNLDKNNIYESDFRRMLWQLAHMQSLDPESVIGRSDFITSTFRESAVFGAFQFRDILINLLQGDVSVPIQKIKFDRKVNILKKALLRCDFSQKNLTHMKIDHETFTELVEVVRSRGDNGLVSRLQHVFEQIDIMLLEVESVLTRKLNAIPRNQREYHINAIGSFMDDYINKLIREIYHIPQGEESSQATQIYTQFQRSYTQSTPYIGYDSIGKYTTARTVLKPKGLEAISPIDIRNGLAEKKLHFYNEPVE